MADRTAVRAAAPALALVLGALALSAVFSPRFNLASFYLYAQDRWILAVAPALLIAAHWRLRAHTAPLAIGRRTAALALVALMAACVAGRHWLLFDHDLSRDEQMATFDAAVYATGHLAARLPVLWRDHADALNTVFMYPAVHRAAWISAYLPLNAGVRAAIGMVVDPALAGPLMTGLAGLALLGCVRRLWPDDREAPVVALLLYAGSAQVVMTGMTSYAMPAHLACNLIWLWLFLGNTRRQDAAALLVGMVATGLHQPIVHPLFAAPFLILLVGQRQWYRLAHYAIGYALIGAFWLWWPTAIWHLVQADPHALPPPGVDFWTRLTTLLRHPDPLGLPEMLANLLRFAAWQHVLLVPLLFAGARIAARGTDAMAAALLRTIVFTVLTMMLVLPLQGHGFGYRYLHGMIGSAILLAIHAWRSFGDAAPRWRTLLVRTSLAMALVMLPLQAAMVRAFYDPNVRVSRAIDAIDADYVVIGRYDVPFSQDLIYNPPALDRRPIRLMRDMLDAEAIADICRTHPSVVLAGNALLRPITDSYGVVATRADRGNAQIAPALHAAGCRL